MIHPCADMNNKDVWQFIKKNKIPYPSDYTEGYTHEFCNFMTKESLLSLKKNYPDDIENLKMDFPLIESLFYTKD